MAVTSYLKDKRIIALIIVVLALAILDFHFGLNLGIEFGGGTQIPITLQHSVNASAMSSVISVIQQRVSTFGLKEVPVEGIGNSTIYVDLPSNSSTEINQTISIIQSQGTFEGIVNGKEAENGSSILKGSIGVLQPVLQNGSATWTVTFYLTNAGSTYFAKQVFGQGNKPLYLFLNRPSNSIILLNATKLANLTTGVNQSAAVRAVQAAFEFGNQSIPVIAVYNTNASIASAENFLSKNNKTYKKVIIDQNLGKGIIDFAKKNNYTIVLANKSNTTPQITNTGTGLVVSSWPVAGLIGSPALSPDITNGSSSSSFEITGAVPTSVPPSQQVSYAAQQGKTIQSVLSGGALPVSVIVGTPTTIPPTLGKHFLRISIYILAAAIIAMSIFIVIRYKRIFLVTPILIITLMELFIIISIVGLIGNIDVAAVAGMIAVVGTGVDAQIIITDEVLARRNLQSSAKEHFGNAFYIVWTDAMLLIVAMLPLFFSTSLVNITGFSISTIIGALLGVLVTRPAYGAIIEKHFVVE